MRQQKAQDSVSLCVFTEPFVMSGEQEEAAASATESIDDVAAAPETKPEEAAAGEAAPPTRGGITGWLRRSVVPTAQKGLTNVGSGVGGVVSNVGILAGNARSFAGSVLGSRQWRQIKDYDSFSRHLEDLSSVSGAGKHRAESIHYLSDILSTLSPDYNFDREQSSPSSTPPVLAIKSETEPKAKASASGGQDGANDGETEEEPHYLDDNPLKALAKITVPHDGAAFASDASATSEVDKDRAKMGMREVFLSCSALEKAIETILRDAPKSEYEIVAFKNLLDATLMIDAKSEVLEAILDTAAAVSAVHTQLSTSAAKGGNAKEQGGEELGNDVREQVGFMSRVPVSAVSYLKW